MQRKRTALKPQSQTRSRISEAGVLRIALIDLAQKLEPRIVRSEAVHCRDCADGLTRNGQNRSRKR
jgi:hypothetical protein